MFAVSWKFQASIDQNQFSIGGQRMIECQTHFHGGEAVSFIDIQIFALRIQDKVHKRWSTVSSTRSGTAGRARSELRFGGKYNIYIGKT